MSGVLSELKPDFLQIVFSRIRRRVLYKYSRPKTMQLTKTTNSNFLLAKVGYIKLGDECSKF